MRKMYLYCNAKRYCCNLETFLLQSKNSNAYTTGDIVCKRSFSQEKVMEILNRFKAGINAASDSFYILKKHWALLSYFGIITIAKMVLAIWTTSSSLHAYTSSLFVFIINIPLQLVLIMLTLFAQIALTHHAVHIFDGETTTIQASMRTAIHKWQPMLIWASITFVITLIFGQLARIHNMQPLEISFGVLGLAWSLLTAFVPTAIAIENLTILEYIQHSFIVIRNYLFKFIGGMFWIGIVFVLCMVPFSCARLIAYFAPQLYYNLFFLQLISAIELIVQWGIGSACAIFKAMLYMQYKQNIDELQQLNYPRM